MTAGVGLGAVVAARSKYFAAACLISISSGGMSDSRYTALVEAYRESPRMNLIGSVV